MPWPGAMASWLLMESMPMGSYPGLFLFIESWVFMALDVFHELLSFQESIYSWDSVSWNLAIPGYAIHRIIGFRGPGLFPGLTFTQVIIDSLPWAYILDSFYSWFWLVFCWIRNIFIPDLRFINELAYIQDSFLLLWIYGPGLAHWITNLFFILFLVRFIEARIYSSFFSWLDLLKLEFIFLFAFDFKIIHVT